MRLLLFFLLSLSLSCAGALWVTQQPVPETAKVVEQADGTKVLLVANKTTCFLIWTVAEGSTPCGSSAQWAEWAAEVMSEGLRFGRSLLPGTPPPARASE